MIPENVRIRKKFIIFVVSMTIKLHVVVNRFMKPRSLFCTPEFWSNKLPWRWTQYISPKFRYISI